MRPSLRLRLAASLGATVLLTWGLAAAVSYWDARDRIGHMLDDHLVQAADLLLGASGKEAQRPAVHWGDDAHALLFQAWSADGDLLFRSSDAPDTPLSPIEEGYSEVDSQGRRWRVYGSRSTDGSLVQVAEHADFRETLAGRIAAHLLVPSLLALPILAGLIWLAVGWALGPLRGLARDVSRRNASDLDPLERAAPDEVAPLVDALDSLFRRVSQSMEHERRFTADAAHELRTPLAAIRTHAEVALAAKSEEERERALTQTVKGTERANHLVEQLLTLARLDARQGPAGMGPVRVDELAREQVAQASSAAAAADRNLGVEAPLTEAPAWADPGLLRILLRNLIDNAIRYTHPNDQIDVSVFQRGGRIVLRVADSGPGMAPGQRERALERFTRGDGAAAQGSGIGLSIVARIADLHQASVTLGEGLDGAGLSVEVALRAA